MIDVITITLMLHSYITNYISMKIRQKYILHTKILRVITTFHTKIHHSSVPL